MSIRSVLGSRASIAGVLGSGRGGAPAAWYLAGGVSAANCVAAYQPKGAVSLAASYTNLANPGTYNAAPGATPPAWDTSYGWSISGSVSTISASISGNQNFSVLIRFSDRTSGSRLGGLRSGGAYMMYLAPFWSTVTLYYYNGGFVTAGAAITSGVSGMAGAQPYKNGGTDGSPFGAATFTTNSFDIQPGMALTCKVQAVAIYNTTLTAPQVAAISSAMSLL